MRRPSPTEPVAELKRVPIRENGEPMVDFSIVCPELVIASPVYRYTRATLVRATIAKMLNRAAEAIPRGYRLGILEGWRPNYIQRRMYLTQWIRFKQLHPDWSDLQLRRVVNRFTHPHDAKAPPPHASGGAVDVMLVDADGQRLDHSSPYKVFDPKNYSHDCPGLSDIARKHRQILREAMLHGGMTNYPSEYWHWSYGDQGWAYRGSHAPGVPLSPAPPVPSLGQSPQGFAIYGPIFTPEGWTPVAEDDNDEPLERLWGGGVGSGFPRKAS